MTAATDALARLDDGDTHPGDHTLADIFDRHCQWGARPCLICGAEGGPECLSCVIAAEVEAKRTADQ
ncbi:hypothetical protein ACQP2Y_21885 [Actinoplanes sp. CA-051413]|uniref:hypothetical protein n=1 Tax=Actinoplanes sp. CA-051413 TaxID=3239899 RepID=UPI003D9542B2